MPTVGETHTALEGAITIERRFVDWMAFVGGDRRVWASGQSVQEAVGHVVWSHPAEVIEAVTKATQPAEEQVTASGMVEVVERTAADAVRLSQLSDGVSASSDADRSTYGSCGSCGSCR